MPLNIRNSLVCLLVSAAMAAGQQPSASTVQSILPAGARVIESADLSDTVGKPRALVLWMLHPKKIVRDPGPGYCGDSVYGDHWIGPVRLSLLDTSTNGLLNTVKVIGPAFYDGPKDSLSVPYFVGRHYYHVPQVNRSGEGKPNILSLRDFTGDEIAAEFVLFMYAACGIAETAVFGYDPAADLVVNYPIEIRTAGERPKRQVWIEQVFSVRPLRPGYWKFTWKPGHGSDDSIHEDVSFDPARKVFVDRQRITQ